uniref:Uncharacterized protein n=1 Tax=Oryza meridionalis TaxID=40149 RepID=A0A0E0DYJ0_9ORYZ
MGLTYALWRFGPRKPSSETQFRLRARVTESIIFLRRGDEAAGGGASAGVRPSGRFRLRCSPNVAGICS